MKQLFIGLDVHKKTWAVTIQEQHLIRKRFTIDEDADLLISYVARYFPHHQVSVVMNVVAAAIIFITPILSVGR